MAVCFSESHLEWQIACTRFWGLETWFLKDFEIFRKIVMPCQRCFNIGGLYSASCELSVASWFLLLFCELRVASCELRVASWFSIMKHLRLRKCALTTRRGMTALFVPSPLAI